MNKHLKTLITLVVAAFLVLPASIAVTVLANSPDDDDCPERAFGLYCDDDPSPVDNPNLDCPERALGLYCPDDPSPVDDPNLDCPEREFGLYCPDDPSPEDNPNLPSPTPTPAPASDGGDGGDGGGSDGGGGGGDQGPDPEPEPTPQPKRSRVLGTKTGISAVDRRAADFIPDNQVPVVVERIFVEVFGRNPTHAESVYWKARARSDKATETKLKGAMLWHKSRGSTGVKLGTNVAGATSSFIPNNLVPAYVERVFKEVFGRQITPAESGYWKHRVRTDKRTESELRGAMYWHKAHGSTGVKQSLIKGAISSIASRINAIFRSVYGRNPTPSENRYWLSRLADKVTETALRGAMLFHKQQGIVH